MNYAASVCLYITIACFISGLIGVKLAVKVKDDYDMMFFGALASFLIAVSYVGAWVSVGLQLFWRP